MPTDLRGTTDIEADHEGGFVVTEGHHTPPRRTARFHANGKLRREWYGAQHYGVSPLFFRGLLGVTEAGN